MRYNDAARLLLSARPLLTAREADVLVRIALSPAGKKGNAAVASALAITEKTVKNILLPVALKLGISSEESGSLRLDMAMDVLSALGVALPTIDV